MSQHFFLQGSAVLDIKACPQVSNTSHRSLIFLQDIETHTHTTQLFSDHTSTVYALSQSAEADSKSFDHTTGHYRLGIAMTYFLKMPLAPSWHTSSGASLGTLPAKTSWGSRIENARADQVLSCSICLEAQKCHMCGAKNLQSRWAITPARSHKEDDISVFWVVSQLRLRMCTWNLTQKSSHSRSFSIEKLKQNNHMLSAISDSF